MITAILAAAASGLILCTSPAVIDGDTMVCGDQRIRLWGVDAPESYTAAGPAASRALADLTTGQTLVCKAKGRSYNRTVAQCWIGKTDVAGEMVRQGKAVDWPKFSKGYYSGGGK